jgi:opacity protein-like surface antigen
MRFGWRAILIVLLVTAVSPAAAEDRAGFYAGLRLIGSVADLTKVEGVGFTGPLVENQSSDITGGGGGVIGYRWGRLPLRTELEIAHRVRFDWNSRDNGSPAIGYQDNLDSTNVLCNILLEYRNMSDFTPFLGGTLGWARNHSSVERTNIATLASESQDFTENNLAWGVMLGLDWAFARRWSAEFAYRYINLGPASTGSFSGGDEVKADAYVAHDIMLSGMYKW